MAEAVVQLKKGLELLAGLPDDETGERRELDLQVALGIALMAAEGWGSREAVRAYARARELSEQIGVTVTPRLPASGAASRAQAGSARRRILAVTTRP